MIAYLDESVVTNELNYFNIDKCRKKHTCAQPKDMIVMTLVQALKKLKKTELNNLYQAR